MKKTFKYTFLAINLMFILFMFLGCTSNKSIEYNGQKINVPKNIERIISTAPSNTEVLIDLGLSDKIVAIDKYSSDVEGLKGNIEKLDFSNPDAEKIIKLNPDIIIASSHNKTETGQDPFKAIEEAGIPVVYIPSSTSIDGIYNDIKFISSLFSKDEKGNEIIANMKKEINSIQDISKNIKNKKKVYFEIGSSPNLFSFGEGTFLNEMIEIVGAENIFKDKKQWISPTEESVIKSNPDVILTNEGYIENATNIIKARNGWENINAIKNNNVYMIDMNSSSRPSQHIIKALKEMAKSIYPEYYEK